MKKSLNTIAEEVIKRLEGKVIIHRYDSYSTNSIYLKFDYGVANSLRISDHNGKKHLKYRYNILESLDGISSKKESHRQGFPMYFYSPKMINACCKDILSAKSEKEKQFYSYEAVVNAAAQKSKTGKGFWSGAKLISN